MSMLPKAVLNLAFRPFFLLGAVFFVVALVRWGLFLNGWVAWPGALSPLTWHVHEMTVGFGAAIALGFLLTAVQNWTGVPGISGVPLAFMVGFWLLGRGVLWVAPDVSRWWWVWPDLLCLAYGALWFARPVIQKKQWRNLVFLPALLAIAVLHLALLLPSLQLDGSALLWCMAVFMTVIGGRIIPLFTANRFGLARSSEPLWQYGFLVAGTLALVVLVALGESGSIPARALFLMVALAHLRRAVRWYTSLIWHDSLIWTLHLSYWALPLTALVLALAGPASSLGHNAQHILALQGVSLMILAMVSRVSLGHTGRPLRAPAWLGLVAIFLMAGMLARVVVPVFAPPLSGLGFNLAVVLSALGLAVFAIRYYPILTSPRPDGRPG